MALCILLQRSPGEPDLSGETVDELEAQLAQGKAGGVFGPFVDPTRGSPPLRHVRAHPHELRSLSGKEKREAQSSELGDGALERTGRRH